MLVSVCVCEFAHACRAVIGDRRLRSLAARWLRVALSLAIFFGMGVTEPSALLELLLVGRLLVEVPHHLPDEEGKEWIEEDATGDVARLLTGRYLGVGTGGKQKQNGQTAEHPTFHGDLIEVEGVLS
jgi:hypothetical protein